MIQEHITRVSDGDLTQQIDMRRSDEIGLIAQAVNAMTANLKNMIERLAHVIDSAAGSSQQLSAASQENSATLQEVAASISRFAHTSSVVSDNAQSMAEKAEHVSALSEHGADQMTQMVSVMQQIRQSSEEERDAIGKLEQAAGRIRIVIDVISKLAEQTALLALNAAIEAARAGEHGRGFAVVADEVRKLADQTQTSVGEIHGIVNDLGEQTTTAVDAVISNGDRIRTGESKMHDTAGAFETISQSVQEMMDLITGVVKSNRDMENGSQELASSSQEQSASIAQIASSAEAVAGMAEELQQLVTQFQI